MRQPIKREWPVVTNVKGTTVKKANPVRTHTPPPRNLNKFELHQYDYIIGIDTGTNTGVAVWNKLKKQFDYVGSKMIHEAMDYVKELNRLYPGKIYLRVEDARQRNFFFDSGPEKLQGAGSIKRDCSIWEDFLTDLKIPFEMVAPKNNKTKMDAIYFRKVTAWDGITNEHSRDAAMLCFSY